MPKLLYGPPKSGLARGVGRTQRQARWPKVPDTKKASPIMELAFA
ncbi:hypothetical protein [Hymenobacter sedentarius]|nr:hypothetical protein [Hymenobacter sedentarius]